MNHWTYPDKRKRMKECMKNYGDLKNTFVSLCSQDKEYPEIGWANFHQFARKCEFYDKNVTKEDVDRFFTSIKKNSLCRHQFVELVVRIAELKYSEGIEKLIKEKVLPNFEPHPW